MGSQTTQMTIVEPQSGTFRAGWRDLSFQPGGYWGGEGEDLGGEDADAINSDQGWQQLREKCRILGVLTRTQT